MARSSAAIAALLLAGCAPQATPAPAVAAPVPKAYSCDFLRRLSQELVALPADSTLRTMLNDYEMERDELRAALGLPSPKCTNSGASST
jgi:hypothetical protein